jgi:hypothetical protein
VEAVEALSSFQPLSNLDVEEYGRRGVHRLAPGVRRRVATRQAESWFLRS